MSLFFYPTKLSDYIEIFPAARDNISNIFMADGGTYLLRDQITGKVRRTGRTKDLERREGEHARHDETKSLIFEIDRITNGYAQQRGREQILHDLFPEADLNKIKAIRDDHPLREEYIERGKEL